LCGSEHLGNRRGRVGAGDKRENCSPESSALLAELPPTLAPVVAELDIVEARDTLWPESFITMARLRRKGPPFATQRTGAGDGERRLLQGASRGAEPSYRLRRETGGIFFFWRGGRNQSNGGAEVASLSTTKNAESEKKKYLKKMRLEGVARFPRATQASQAEVCAQNSSLGVAQVQTAKQRQDCCSSEQNRGRRRRFGDWTSDEKALPRRPLCSDTVPPRCGPACSAAPASSDQGFTVRCRRWAPLERLRTGLGWGAAWKDDGGPLLAVWIGRGSHGAPPACTSTHELRACTTSRRSMQAAMYLYVRVRSTCWSGPSRFCSGQSAGARASCCRTMLVKGHVMKGMDINMYAYVCASSPGCRTHQLLILSCIGGMTAKYLRSAGP
jgi:hypothetical protein